MQSHWLELLKKTSNVQSESDINQNGITVFAIIKKKNNQNDKSHSVFLKYQLRKTLWLALYVKI